jgi:hypothetical protein
LEVADYLVLINRFSPAEILDNQNVQKDNINRKWASEWSIYVYHGTCYI